METIKNYILEGGFYKNVGSDRAVTDFNDEADELLEDLRLSVKTIGEGDPYISTNLTERQIEIERQGSEHSCPKIIIDLNPLLPSLVEYRRKYGPGTILICVDISAMSPINYNKIHVNFPKTIEGLRKGNIDKVHVRVIGCKNPCPFGIKLLKPSQLSYWTVHVEGPKSYKDNLLYSCVRFAYDGPFDKGKWTVVEDKLKDI